MFLVRHDCGLDPVGHVHLRQSMGSLREQSDSSVDGNELSQLVCPTAGGDDLRTRLQPVDWCQSDLEVNTFMFGIGIDKSATQLTLF